MESKGIEVLQHIAHTVIRSLISNGRLYEDYLKNII